MALDRKKFKASSVSKMQNDDAQLTSRLGKGGNRAGMLDITPGKNVFRIYPGHPDESLPEDDQPGFSQPSVKTFLPMLVEEKDKEGKLTGNMKESAKPVFNSKVHGGTPKDLVEEYIKLARKIADNKWPDAKDKNTKQNFLDNIYGKFSPVQSERKMGINYKTSHVMYAEKMIGESAEFGRLEVKESVKINMNKISASESGGDPLGMDPFTDLDDGRALVINYDDKSKTPAGYYLVNLDTDFDKVTKMIKLYSITDEKLEFFEKQPTLVSMYVGAFKQKDFELQMTGLEFFDNKNKMGIWDTDEWQGIVKEISSYYSPEAAEVVDEAEEGEEEDEESEGDEFSAMSRIQLKTYIASNKLGIVIKPSFTDEAIADLIREKIGVTEDEADEVEEEQEEEDEKPAPIAKPMSRLAGLRKNK